MLMAAVALLALQEDAEAVFKKFETRYSEAKAVSVKLKLVVVEEGRLTPAASGDGRIRYKAGDKCALRMAFKEGGDHRIDFTSDGTWAVKSTEDPARPKKAQSGMTRFLSASLTRGGFALMLLIEKRSKEPPDPSVSMKVSGFTMDQDGPDRVLGYTLTAQGFGDVPVKLWLTPGLVPTKRVLRVKNGDKQGVITETYEEVSTDDIPDVDFEVKPP